jgi:hypothetical protein
LSEAVRGDTITSERFWWDIWGDRLIIPYRIPPLLKDAMMLTDTAVKSAKPATSPKS